MSLLLLLLGPSVMIALGLLLLENIPVTFILFYGWLLLAPLVDSLLIRRQGLRETLLQFGLFYNKRNLFTGYLVGGVFFLVMSVSMYLYHPYFFDRDHLDRLLQQWEFTGAYTGWLILILIAVNPLLEETYWRGFMFHRLEGRLPGGARVFVTSFFYALYHLGPLLPMMLWPANVLFTLPVFAAGVVWAVMRQWSGSLWGSVASHAIADMAIIGVYLLYIV
ncbi:MULTISPECIES: CPBP family intramembrane glutamic endopeptidase [Paenibacillus]|uniref:CPBP family intramembrane glutamic endopeptidase n=1 Tax=Paenibacillus TaxID=44249 RepID=UPI0022B8FE2D|nr:type II CAAX endopeptidase family protein [Paenibacillus caseinilyticus]MCZ8521156.1 type II CAAX endopeptidase family protein [Paenibacillus caseinilyticus]